MTTESSPTGENDPPYTATVDGRRCRVVPIDLDGKHKQSEMGQTWAPFGAPLATAQSVAEFAPEGWDGKLQIRSDPPKQEDAKLPKFLQNRASPPEVAPAVEKAASDPVIWAPFEGGMFAYLRRLRDAHDLTPAEFRMLTLMATYADNDDLGDVFPGHERLASHMGYSGSGAAKQVGRVVAALIRKGFVLQVSGGTSAGDKRAAVYRLGVPATESPRPR